MSDLSVSRFIYVKSVIFILLNVFVSAVLEIKIKKR